jgi:uncharacterized protein
MAALSHITALLPFMGVVVPIVIWVTQKDKSPYVAFQALQAMTYQITMILAWFVGMACYMSSFFGLFLGTAVVPSFASSASAEAWFVLPFMLLPFVTLGLIFVGGMAFVIYGLIGGVMALQGKEFRYVVIGWRIERYLEQGQTGHESSQSTEAAA